MNAHVSIFHYVVGIDCIRYDKDGRMVALIVYDMSKMKLADEFIKKRNV